MISSIVELLIPLQGESRASFFILYVIRGDYTVKTKSDSSIFRKVRFVGRESITLIFTEHVIGRKTRFSQLLRQKLILSFLTAVGARIC